jgi:hypothetical protein
MEKLVFGWGTVRIETMLRQTDYLEILVNRRAPAFFCAHLKSVANGTDVHVQRMRWLLTLHLPIGIPKSPLVSTIFAAIVTMRLLGPRCGSVALLSLVFAARPPLELVA